MVQVALVDLTDGAGVGMEKPGAPEGVILHGRRGEIKHGCIMTFFFYNNS